MSATPSTAHLPSITVNDHHVTTPKQPASYAAILGLQPCKVRQVTTVVCLSLCIEKRCGVVEALPEVAESSETRRRSLQWLSQRRYQTKARQTLSQRHHCLAPAADRPGLPRPVSEPAGPRPTWLAEGLEGRGGERGVTLRSGQGGVGVGPVVVWVGTMVFWHPCLIRGFGEEK